jgi:hypothetical protein
MAENFDLGLRRQKIALAECRKVLEKMLELGKI